MPRLPDSPPPNHFLGPAGFTLAELLVVVVLLGLLLSFVLPRLTGFEDEERLKTAVRRLAGQALEAHTQAVTEARPIFLCLDLSLNRFWLSSVRPGPEGQAGLESPVFVLPGGVTFQDVFHPNDGQVREGRLSFGYWPQGGGEPGTIHLQNTEGQKMTIFLRPFLGRTEIRPGYLREENTD